MSSTGLEVIDKSVQSTNIWLNEIGEVVGPDKQRSYHALRSVLFAVRDRLTTDEAFHLSAQLPLIVRGIFWDGYRPAGKPDPYRSREEFLERVSAGMGAISPMNPEDSARAVFRVLQTHVANGEIEEVKNMLPKDVRTLFPEPAQA